ncbi:MAG: glycosyltransferase family 4 protein [Verrucomicrobiota bacterium]
MKLLVFAHVPPPHHGQSQMVQYIVEGLRRRQDLGVEIHHVDARLSGSLQDVGTARGGKITKLLRHCQKARQLGDAHRIRCLYYVPSPPRRVPLYRDWLALALLRRRFPELIYHWHSAGLGDWLKTSATIPERRLSNRLLGRPDLSLVLAEVLRHDAEQVRSRRVEVVNNAVSDPFPEYHVDRGQRRHDRLEELRTRGGTVRVLFLALCSRDKGLFDAIEAICLANSMSTGSGSRLRFQLDVAGGFPDAETEREFRERTSQEDAHGRVQHLGFLHGHQKQEAMLRADMLIFPSYYAFETHPLTVVEAMAYGMPIVAARWRGIPEMLPGNLAHLVEPRDPRSLAAGLIQAIESQSGPRLRNRFEERYTLDRFLERFAAAVKTVNQPGP